MSSQFISSKKYDYPLIVFSPLIGFILVLAFSSPRTPDQSQILDYNSPVWLILLANVFILAHLTIGFTRSHLNRDVYKRFPLRFTVIPLFIVLLFLFQNNIYLIAFAFTPIWDEIHSFMQTFGFGRIYDAKAGNPPKVGRRFDIILCFVLEFYPHIVRLTTLDLKEMTRAIEYSDYISIDWVFRMVQHTTLPLTLLGVAYILFYIGYYIRLFKKTGYLPSRNKMILFTLTGFVNVVAVTYYTLVEALIINNIYHSIQYYGIIWYSEGKNLNKIFKKASPWFLLISLCFISLILGATRYKTETLPIWGAFWLTCSLIHFWYDGFMWSVRKNQAV
ncbi:MAG: hypothetical protein CME62_10730 [Halobacteriovoraceae bacterium]|nr:hypothetical protein [Halobacteriovoraceae bacterium]|tara:strand:+ start:6944 stop:7942 length:999 start_codon:yes stop_codon:yes gene_type:complete